MKRGLRAHITDDLYVFFETSADKTIITICPIRRRDASVPQRIGAEIAEQRTLGILWLVEIECPENRGRNENENKDQCPGIDRMVARQMPNLSDLCFYRLQACPCENIELTNHGREKAT